MGFLFLILHPVRLPVLLLPSSRRQPYTLTTCTHTTCHTQLNLLTHNLLTYNLLTHNFHTYSFTWQAWYSTYSHTQLVHTQLTHTQLTHAQLAHIQLTHAGVALGDMDRHFAWQAFPRAHVVAAAFCVAGVVLGHTTCQQFHVATLRGRRGTL